jgi:hypothetical protein
MSASADIADMRQGGGVNRTDLRAHIAAIHTAGNALAALLDVDPRDGLNVPGRIVDACNGWPASATGGGGGGGSTNSHSDPTGTAALQDDQAARDLRVLAEKLTAAADIAARYQLRAANAYDQSQAGEPCDGCVSCARSEDARGNPRWEPTHRGDLCRWCYDQKRATGELPPVDLLRRHHAGQRPRKAA